VAAINQDNLRLKNSSVRNLNSAHDLAQTLEALWNRQLGRIKERSEDRVHKKTESPTPSNQGKDKS
jgi:hypothetical protein